MSDPFAILSLIVVIPLLGILFILTSKEDQSKNTHNCFNCTIFTIISNLFMIWRVFMLFDEKNPKLQLFEKFNWLTTPDINLVFAVDNFSLMMILAVHLVILIGLIFVKYQQSIEHPKPLMSFTLLFLSFATGLFVSADIFSFFMFFEAMLIPLFMLIGMYGNFKKPEKLGGFFLYNLLGSFILLAAILLIYRYYGSLLLDQSSKILWKRNCGWYIWGLLSLSFLFRIPIWPFHYWTASIASKIHNPLVFIASLTLPLSGIYGLIRFWPEYIPLEISQHFVWLNIIGAITMLFISLIGFINKDSQYKIFSYVTVYYIMYLLGVFSRDSQIQMNLCYALFGFLIVVGALEVLYDYIYKKEKSLETASDGFLTKAKRLSILYSFITFAAVGFPISAMFTNNFLIMSKLLSVNIQLGIIIVLSCIISYATLISELIRLKRENTESLLDKHHDISIEKFIFMLFIVFILLMSFIRPLWFVVSD